MLDTPGHVTLEHLTARLFGWQDGLGPLYLRLAEALRVLAETGAVTTGTRLPSERALAAALNVSRNTVTAAYRQLRDTGWLIGHQGAAPRVGATTRVLGNDTVPADALAELFTDEQRPRLDLTIASPRPAPAVLDALTRSPVLMPDSATQGGGYYPAGHPVLLQAIAHKLRKDGINAHPEEIVVTNGAQQALTLVAEALHRPRRPAAVEAVTYPGIIDAIRQRGRSQLVTLPVDQDGLRVDAAVRLIRATTPAAAYLTTFQNPTGHSISRTDREMLLAATEATKTPIVEDRVLADLPLNGQAPPTPLAALRPNAAVTTIGSISKVLWGGLRIGWIHTIARSRCTYALAGALSISVAPPRCSSPQLGCSSTVTTTLECGGFDSCETRWPHSPMRSRPLVWIGSTSNPPEAQTSGSDYHTPPPAPSPTAQPATVSPSQPAVRSPSPPARPAT
jgi:DNA-binding transcriptional MocR family regulator